MDNVREQSNAARGFFSIDEARDRFMDCLHTLEPDCFATLCSLKGLALAKTVQDNLVHSVTSGQAIPHAWEAEQAKQEYISQWQRRWHLVAVPERLSKGDLRVPDWRRMSQRERARWKGSSSEYSWITDIADATLRYYVVNQRYGESVPTSFVALARHDKASRDMDLSFGGQAITVDAKSQDLARYLMTDEGWPLLTWNSRTEPRYKARERLMQLIDGALEHIEQQAPSFSILDEHLDWLVRFQVMGQSQPAIAFDIGRHRAHVTNSINATAVLIGLETRKGSAGRPRRKTGRTVRLE